MKHYVYAYALLVSISLINITHASSMKVNTSLKTKNSDIYQTCETACSRLSKGGRTFTYTGDYEQYGTNNLKCTCDND